jgi:hypothetical protein
LLRSYWNKRGEVTRSFVQGLLSPPVEVPGAFLQEPLDQIVRVSPANDGFLLSVLPHQDPLCIACAFGLPNRKPYCPKLLRTHSPYEGYHYVLISKTKTPWSESASELYRPSDRRLSAKRLPTCADGGCHVASVTDSYGRILGFLDRSRYFSIK